MRVTTIFFLLFIGQLFMDCKVKNETNQPEIKTRSVTFIHEESEVELPASNIHSNSGSLQEWLVHLCDTERPSKAISTYNFGLTESAGEYTLYLVGLNDYEIDEHHSATRIDFEPSNMYFHLPKTEYEHLNWQEVMAKVETELLNFTKTEKFEDSFFSHAKLIKTATGIKIWPR